MGGPVGSLSVTLTTCPRRKSAAADVARTRSTSLQRRTGTSDRSRLATGLLAMSGRLSTRYSTRSLQITRNSLERAIRHAESNALIARNVPALVKSPQGRNGRPSKSFPLDADARALRVSDARCLGPLPCRPVASGQVSSASTSVFVNVRYATRTTIEARNIPLVAVVPRPSPPASRGCESRSPSEAPNGRVST